jgi:NAD(P)-dependent dehydrogenase (short-subunit alcohol dehydrogenase family)
VDNNVLGLEGKGALVVGGGRGIGRETALLLASVGANVVIGDIDAGRGDSVADEVATMGVRSLAVRGDATDPGEAQTIVESAAGFYDGHLDVVINIVGIASWVTLLDVDDAMWDDQFANNLRHHLYIGRAAARQMILASAPGRIALVASVDGFYGSPNHAAYGAAKAGVVSLTKTMAQEWGQYGIRVNAIAPDAILTPRVEVLLAARGVNLQDHDRQLHRPLSRMGTPAEIAGPLVFLVSDLSSYVSGQTLIVDGGLFGVPAGHRA